MDDAAAALTRAWLVKASHDLDTARIVGATPGGPLDTAIYHCQQCAEKSLKAFLVSRDVGFEKTHDLGHLLSLATAPEPSLAQWTSAAEILTPYATAFRYPATGEDPMPTRSEFEEALRLADAVFAFVLGLLPPAARPATE